VTQSLGFTHITYAIGRRIYMLFVSDGHFLGTAATDRRLALAARQGMKVAGLVAVAQNGGGHAVGRAPCSIATCCP